MPDFPDPAWDAILVAHPEEGDIVAYDMSCVNHRAHAALDSIMKQRPVTIDGLAVVARAARLEIDWWWSEVDGSLKLDEHREIQFSLAEATLAFVAQARVENATADLAGMS